MKKLLLICLLFVGLSIHAVITDNYEIEDTLAIIVGGETLYVSPLHIWASDSLTIDAIILDSIFSLFGLSIETGEITDGTILTDDIADGTIVEADLGIVNAGVEEDILTYEAITGNFEWQTPTELSLMEDADINTFAELQSWVSDKTLVNEEDIFTIDANWVNTANPWADNEVAEDLTISATGSVHDDALGADVSLLGQTIESGEITNATIEAIDIKAGTIDESTMNIINAGVEEDILTFEQISGDFEWMTPAELDLAKETEVPGMTSTTVKPVFAFCLYDVAAEMDGVAFQFPRAITITKVIMKCTAGTNVVGRLYEVDGDGDPGDKVGVEVGDWTVTTTETEDSSFNNATFDAGDYIWWETTSVAGSVTMFICTVYGYET